MKKLAIFMLLYIFIVTTFLGLANSFANECEVLDDTIFSYPHDVCIDPGHGGPTACRNGTGCNGDAAGSYGYDDSLSEQWINLQVAHKLKEFLNGFNCPWNPSQRVVMTRTGETDIPLPYLGWWWRINVSRHGNAGFKVREFISIHHNGFPTDSAKQGTESFWCDYLTTLDSGFTRDTSSTLARKVRSKIHDYFNTDAECYECYRDRGTKLKYDNFVLNRVTSTHVLSEASDITWHPDEEALFGDDPNGWHAHLEAIGIHEGWCSYKNKSGFVTVKNRALTGEDGFMWITGSSGQTVYTSPYETVWGKGETWRIDFPDYQYIGGVVDTFHHLREVETGYYSTYSSLEYTVPQCSTHTIIGYYRGGPYSVSLEFPNSGQFSLGDSLYIDWYSIYTSKGVDTTAVIDAYLDRHYGRSGYPEKILSNIPVRYFGSWWKVSSPASDSCKIKLVSHDCVDNTASDTSDYWFSIIVPNISGDCNSDGKVDLTDVIYLANCVLCVGPCPQPRWKGDVNGNCVINLQDVILLSNYVLKGWAAPWCNSGCPDWDCE